MARANEYGAQCAVVAVAVSPADERNIVVVTRRVGGSSAFRTVNDGHSWTAIADVLTQANPQLDLACAAIHPTLSNVVYLGARNGRRVFVSPDGGQTWPQQRDPGGKVTQLIVDRNSGGDWHTATLYAGTDAGVAYSINGGDTWSMAAIGEVTSLAVYMPASGARRFYAGVYGRGLFYAESPAGPWQNLFGTAPGLPPAPASGANMVVLVDYCPRQPDRVYAVVSTLSLDHRGPGAPHLYVSVAAPPLGDWEERGAGVQPPLDWGLEGLSFMVAPEPFGLDTGDVLFCSGGIYLQRSVDGGRTWQVAYPNNILHTDTRSLAHHPPKTAYYPEALSSTASAPRARVYVGNDGGLGASRGYSDSSFMFGSFITGDFNSGPTYNTSLGIVESLDHGLASLAAHQFASNPDPLAGGPMSMLGYVTTLDTGTHRHIGSTVWRNIDDGDSGVISVAPTTNGVRAWVNESEYIIWPVWNFVTWVDRDGWEEFQHVVTAAASSSGATSNIVPGGGESVYVGIIALEQVTTLLSPVTSHTAEVEVVPVTMTPDLILGARVCLGDPELVGYQPISSVSADRFHVYIIGSHTYPAGTAVRVVHSYVARVTGNSAARISQIFIPQTRRIYRLAKSGEVLLGASADQRLWTVSSVSTAGETTVWTEVTGRPSELSTASLGGPDDITGDGEYVSGVELQRTTPLISDLVADASGDFYAMLSSPVTVTSSGGGTVLTSLFRIAGGAWVAESCTPPGSAAIPPGVALGRVVAHPTQPGRLFVARNERVFQLDRGMTSWTWTDLTDNLPGQEIHDLWIGNIAAVGAAPRLVLRATTAVRGVWEMEIGAPPISGAHFYFRDHSFDPGWTRPSADGVLSPLRAGQHHWHWQSADIKVDTPLRDSTGTLYYQNDPEASAPTADDVAWFKDRSQAAAAGTTARIWVRVNNRSTVPAGEVSVWAITCRFSGTLPALPAMFWSRFHSDGTLDSTSALSADWTSLGVHAVSGVHAEAPGLVEFEMPTGAEGDHRCVVVFVHGPAAALDTTGLTLVIDEVVPAHNQIAQRNVLVGPPLPASPGTPAPPSQRGDTGLGGTLAREIYIEFNNPWPEDRKMTVRFDLANLPPAISLQFRLSRNARPEVVAGAQPPKLGCMAWPLNLVRELWGGSRSTSTKTKRLQLQSAVYVPDGAAEIELRDMPVPAGGKVAAQLQLRHEGLLAPGSEYHIDLIQLTKDRVVGGATVILPVSQAKPSQENEYRIDWEAERDIGSKIETARRAS